MVYEADFRARLLHEFTTRLRVGSVTQLDRVPGML